MSIIKQIYYKTIDGKEAQSLSPVITKMKIKFFLKPANDLLAITFLLRLFHSFTTLLLKEYFRNVERNTLFLTLIDDL